jgi:hypothetical protein
MLYIATNKQLVDNPCLAWHRQNPAAYPTTALPFLFMTRAQGSKIPCSLDLRDSQQIESQQSGTQLVEYLNPALYMTVANQDDNPTLTEAMNGPDAAGFFKAMEQKLETLIQMEVFTVLDRKPWMKVISSVWAFKRKRFPDGSVWELKARLCARGFEQIEGRDYFETFARVVQCLTVRLILVMTIIMGLENKQIDYTAAFVQAPIDTDVYIEMPRMFSAQGKVWKLRKSIYGLKQSPRNYFLHLKQKLERLGFTQSNADPCLFISTTVICLVYVDDALLLYQDQSAVVLGFNLLLSPVDLIEWARFLEPARTS